MKVIIYTTPDCLYCNIAKKFFDKKEIKWEEKKVLEDEGARKEMVKKSHQMGVPVIDIEGEIFVGFDRKAIEDHLSKRSSRK